MLLIFRKIIYTPWRVSRVLQEIKLSLHNNPSPPEVVYVVDGPSTKWKTMANKHTSTFSICNAKVKVGKGLPLIVKHTLWLPLPPKKILIAASISFSRLEDTPSAVHPNSTF